MSKAERLKAKSQKQLEEKKQLEKQEQEEKAAAQVSRSAKKYRRQAKNSDSAVTLILKILMTLPFAWSGFYYGGIFTIGILTGDMIGMPKRTAVFFAAGSLLCLAGIILAFFSKYIIQFVLIAVGTVCYMHSAVYVITTTQKKLAEKYVTDPQVLVLDKTYMKYFYPMTAVAAISAILLAVYLVKYFKKKKRIRQQKDNAPVKSIVE